MSLFRADLDVSNPFLAIALIPFTFQDIILICFVQFDLAGVKASKKTKICFYLLLPNHITDRVKQDIPD